VKLHAASAWRLVRRGRAGRSNDREIPRGKRVASSKRKDVGNGKVNNLPYSWVASIADPVHALENRFNFSQRRNMDACPGRYLAPELLVSAGVLIFSHP